uniref:BTB/POZ domain-containing protein At1g63850 n=1 Tax=Anthurium amnicola TaxID=1678845 RepID=A0A1D1XZ36_9ARAE
MDGAAGAAAAPPPPAAAVFAPYPASYNKFNSALNAGLLNPMSPPPALPLDKTRSSPTLFEMMANEQDCHPRNQIQTSPLPPPPLPPGRHHHSHPPLAMLSAQERQLLLQDRVGEILGSCSPGNPLGDPETGDVRLTLTSRDGLSVSMAVHRHVLVAHSRFFAAKLADRWSKPQSQQQPRPSAVPQHLVEISDCDDVEVYVETLRLMYCRDLRRRLMREDVPKVLAILKVSAAIGFDAGVLSCLEYLEAAPWAEEEEEKVASLLSQLHLENSGAGEVLKRVSLEVAASAEDESGGGEEVLIRLLQVVLEGKDEKARREMKGLVSKMLRESNRSAAAGTCYVDGIGGSSSSSLGHGLPAAPPPPAAAAAAAHPLQELRARRWTGRRRRRRRPRHPRRLPQPRRLPRPVPAPEPSFLRAGHGAGPRHGGGGGRMRRRGFHRVG